MAHERCERLLCCTQLRSHDLGSPPIDYQLVLRPQGIARVSEEPTRAAGAEASSTWEGRWTRLHPHDCGTEPVLSLRSPLREDLGLLALCPIALRLSGAWQARTTWRCASACEASQECECGGETGE